MLHIDLKSFKMKKTKESNSTDLKQVQILSHFVTLQPNCQRFYWDFTLEKGPKISEKIIKMTIFGMKEANNLLMEQMKINVTRFLIKGCFIEPLQELQKHILSNILLQL